MSKLLVVEDDIDIRETLKELFEDESYEVACSAEGDEAFRHLRSTPSLPDLILLDLMMPVMNGYVFRNQQREDVQLRRIPVIVMTADDRITDELSLLEAVAFVRKPVRIRELLELVRRHCPFQ